MPFELEQFTKVRVLDVRVLAAKDRKPDDPPGAQMLLQSDLPADALSMFDGSMKGQFFRKAGTKQGTLEGMDGLEKTTFAEHVQRLKWQYEQTGCSIEIDRGLGGKRNITLDDCKVHRVLISPREGSVMVQWTVDAPGLSDATWGKLPGLKATDIQMAMLAPTVDDAQQELDDGEKPAPARKPGAAERAAVAKAGASTEPVWPFPTGSKASSEAPPQSATTETVPDATETFIERSQPGTRTARGRERTAKALAAKATH